MTWWVEGPPCRPPGVVQAVVFALWEVCTCGQGPRAWSSMNAMSDGVWHHPDIHFANSPGVMSNRKGKCG